MGSRNALAGTRLSRRRKRVYRTSERERLYMRVYMRAYRSSDLQAPAHVPPRPKFKLIRRTRPPVVFKPLPADEQKHGHCTFCGLRSYLTVCGFCAREIERAA